jgi:DNA polymerase-3 subunit gamma/tau
VLLCKDTATASLLTHGDKIRARYLDQAEAIQKSSLITYLDLINQCEINYSRALHKWLHIEMALIRMCYMHRRIQTESGIASGTEKKKPDATSGIVSASIAAVNGKPKFTSEDNASSGPLSSDQETSVAAQKTVSEIQGDTSISALEGYGGKTGDAGIPSLQGLGMLRQKAEVRHEEEKKKIPVLTLGAVLDFWKAFAENHSSPSMRQTMAEAIIEIKDEKIIFIRTGHQTGKNRLTADVNLLEGLRSMARLPDLQIVIDIDPELDKSRDIVKPKKLLSNREKFEILSAKNPLMHQLRDKLDLIPDQDD